MPPIKVIKYIYRVIWVISYNLYPTFPIISIQHYHIIISIIIIKTIMFIIRFVDCHIDRNVKTKKCGRQSSQRLDCNFSLRLYVIAPIMLLNNHTPLLFFVVFNMIEQQWDFCCTYFKPRTHYNDTAVALLWPLPSPKCQPSEYYIRNWWVVTLSGLT